MTWQGLHEDVATKVLSVKPGEGQAESVTGELFPPGAAGVRVSLILRENAHRALRQAAWLKQLLLTSKIGSEVFDSAS